MVVAADGTLWNAQYKSGRIVKLSAKGDFLAEFSLPASQTTCPAFGGPDLKTLFCTTAQQDISTAGRAENSAHGQTFAMATDTVGQAEHKVILG